LDDTAEDPGAAVAEAEAVPLGLTAEDCPGVFDASIALVAPAEGWFEENCAGFGVVLGDAEGGPSVFPAELAAAEDVPVALSDPGAIALGDWTGLFGIAAGKLLEFPDELAAVDGLPAELSGPGDARPDTDCELGIVTEGPVVLVFAFPVCLLVSAGLLAPEEACPDADCEAPA
jgi:hypothetical protein